MARPKAPSFDRQRTAILETAAQLFADHGFRGASMADVVKTTIFLADIGDFAAVNAVYTTFMPDPPPARSTFAVGALPKGAAIEI